MDLFQKYHKSLTFNIRLIGKGKPISINEVSTIKDNEYNSSNESGKDVYFRPDGKFGHKFIMLDLDNNPSYDVLSKAKRESFLGIQTSAGHYQFWYYANITDWIEYTIIAKYLCSKFSGDVGSTKKKQVGRIPGYKNKKMLRNNFKVKIYCKNPKLPKLSLSTKEKNKLKQQFTAPSKPPRKPPGGGNSGEANNDPSDIMEKSKRHDWAFLIDVIRRARAMNEVRTRQDLINILRTISMYHDNLDYIQRTVDNFLNDLNNNNVNL